MEDVLDVYHRKYDAAYPVVCMDEQPTQLVKETRNPLPLQPGQPAKYDYEYERNGTANHFMFTEPLGGWRDVRVTQRRTAVDWARQVKALVDDPRYAEADRITLVCDNLNTHKLASLYKAFAPNEALRIANKIELVHTPRHGSWLNMAECELSVLTRQCLAGRMHEQLAMAREAQVWSDTRNTAQTGVDWQFTTDQARVKLKRLYPKIVE